jgi:hypothetical protein
VTARQLLVVVALFQGVLLVALMLLILVNRWERARARAHLLPRRAVVDTAMKEWALGEVDAELVVRGLEALPTAAAVESLVAWSTRLPGERWRALAVELEHRPWARADQTSAL